MVSIITASHNTGLQVPHLPPLKYINKLRLTLFGYIKVILGILGRNYFIIMNQLVKETFRFTGMIKDLVWLMPQYNNQGLEEYSMFVLRHFKDICSTVDHNATILLLNNIYIFIYYLRQDSNLYIRFVYFNFPVVLICF